MSKNLTPTQIKEMRERINNKEYVENALMKIADDLSEAVININEGKVMFEKKNKKKRIMFTNDICMILEDIGIKMRRKL